MGLYDELTRYCKSGAYPFHMPGHKRLMGDMGNPFSIDITEIDLFDNLHHAEGILRKCELEAAALYHSSETYYLVNGSTAGVLSAISACAHRGDILVMARNSHRSAYNAAVLNSLRTIYLYPRIGKEVGGPIDPHDVERVLSLCCSSGFLPKNHPNDVNDAGERGYCDLDSSTLLFHSMRKEALGVDPEEQEAAGSSESSVVGTYDYIGNHTHRGRRRRPCVAAVFITSPTYDGVVSDVKEIARVAHRYGVALIVDEAHGAHFGMHPMFPESSVSLGADIVVHGLHKTLPSLTQTALLHVNGELVDRDRIRQMLGIFQTSSPSYVLMASIDQCIQLLSAQGKKLFEDYGRRLNEFYQSTELDKIRFIRTDDPSKILLKPLAITSRELYDTLRNRYMLQPEMLCSGYVLMLSSVADGNEGFSRLSLALREISGSFESGDSKQRANKDCGRHAAGEDFQDKILGGERPTIRLSMADALDCSWETVTFASSQGRIAGEFLSVYPPGIPLIVPGEVISSGSIERVKDLAEKGLSVHGFIDSLPGNIRVVK